MQFRRVLFVLAIIINFFIFAGNSHAKPEVLGASFLKPKKLNRVLPTEYQVYLKAKTIIVESFGPKPKDLGSIEGAEREILSSRMTNESKLLDHEFDEMFGVLEIRRAEKYVQSKNWARALESFQRGMSTLANAKFPYYWLKTSSAALAKLCKRDKKKRDEACLALARKIVDIFPKNADETKELRELPAIDTLPLTEMGTERLSQTYSEKVEKDEEAFQPVLQAFLKPQEADLLKLGKAFIEAYPKSILRYRTQFLMAEYLFKKGNKEDAKVFYQNIINDTPLSFYAVVASERIGLPLRDRVKKESLRIDRDTFNLNLTEKRSLERLQQLYFTQHYDEVGLEMEAFTRARSYSTDFLLYLISMAARADQHLSGFRFANELIQRKFEGLLSSELIDVLFPDRFKKEIESQSLQSRVDPLLIESLTKQESGFKAQALSSSGAMGLMQIMPFTAIEVDERVVLHRLKEPAINIAIGTKYLASLLEKYNNNVVFALAAYNAGPNRVQKWRKDARPDVEMIEFIEAIPFRETRDYVMSILRNRYWYQYRRGSPLKSPFDQWTPVKQPSL